VLSTTHHIARLKQRNFSFTRKNGVFLAIPCYWKSLDQLRLLQIIKVTEQLTIRTVSDAGPLRVNTRRGSRDAAVISDDELSTDPVEKQRERCLKHESKHELPVQTTNQDTKYTSTPLVLTKYLYFTLFKVLHLSTRTRGGLGEFETVMQTP